MNAHATTHRTPSVRRRRVALVGPPNVGKSALFHCLTGVYTQVSNYPGTTVEITEGEARGLPDTALLDTPGVVTLPAVSEDERVTAQILVGGELQAVLQVGDAKNLRRTLRFTTQLAELGVPLVLALNMSDEASRLGLSIDQEALSEALGLDVVPTVAVRGVGIDRLQEALACAHVPGLSLRYPAPIELALEQLRERLPAGTVSPRAMGLLWLARDPMMEAWLRERCSLGDLDALEEVRYTAQMAFVEPIATVLDRTRATFIDGLVSTAMSASLEAGSGLGVQLARLASHPIVGLPVLAAVLAALYAFVGLFGAGTLVDLVEGQLFGGVINPFVSRMVWKWVPIPLLAEFLVGEYGLWTMGMTYAFALILPIVTTFFLAFGLLEDSGYLPRLSVLTDRVFRAMGLNGRAVLPMILGLGCVTMATLTTRILESRRERVLVILLLALAIPCSAQLGVVVGMLAGVSLAATFVWTAVVIGILLAVGWLAARFVPGERTPLLLELPPLRRPVLANILTKTLARLEWYMKEVIPLFLAGTAVMFVLAKTGGLDWLIRAGEPLVGGWLGLPAEASAAFVMGFLRRDFGATGLFVMGASGALTAIQVVVAMVTVTLFVPCVASVFMIARELNWRAATGAVLITFPLAFFVGGLLNRILLLASAW